MTAPGESVDNPGGALPTLVGGDDPLRQVGTEGSAKRERLGRSTAIITFFNLLSRITGFVRVIAIAGALGIAFLGDAYQRANEVSNVLFELLAGGLLFSVLVPSFVGLIHDHDNDRARRLGGVLVTRGVLVVGAVSLAGMLGSTWIMRALTLGTPASTRADQIELGSFLLWFVMPQLVFYMIGSVGSALLQADNRFVAASVAPVFNNIVVTATMVAFALLHDPASGFNLTMGEKYLLGAGTLAGTIAMTAVPLIALWHCGLGLRPRWRTSGLNLRPLLRRGMWGAGHVGLNEVLIGSTIVLSGRVDGGVIAYQTAFTFFLLPHALLAHPIFTALFPRLSRKAATGDEAGFASDLSLGIRLVMLLLLPGAALLAVVAGPALSIVRLGALDAQGTHLVAMVLAAYVVGLPGYSLFFLLTRASYALDNAKRPTMVNLWVTIASVVGMVIAVAMADGLPLLMVFGLIQAVAVSAGSIALYVLIGRAIGHRIPALSTVVRGVVGAVAAAASAFAIVALVGWHSRPSAVFAVTAGCLVGIAVYVIALAAMKTPELALAKRRALAVVNSRR